MNAVLKMVVKQVGEISEPLGSCSLPAAALFTTVCTSDRVRMIYGYILADGVLRVYLGWFWVFHPVVLIRRVDF